MSETPTIARRDLEFFPPLLRALLRPASGRVLSLGIALCFDDILGFGEVLVEDIDGP